MPPGKAIQANINFQYFFYYPLDLNTKAMIARIWHPFTTPANAEIYENLLKQEIFVGIENKMLKGYRGLSF